MNYNSQIYTLLFSTILLSAVGCSGANPTIYIASNPSTASDVVASGSPLLSVPVQLSPILSGQCLSVAGQSTAVGAQMIQWECGGEYNESFSVFVDSNGQYGVQANLSGLCLNFAGGSGAPGADLIQSPCNASSGEEFTFTPVPNQANTFVLQALSSGLCLDSQNVTQGTNVVQTACGSTLSQQFTLAVFSPSMPNP